jgi:2,4-dienoyl-CoA reductase-like NADH-dependent reductase (Old Yellow Enzyme family)
MNALRTTSPGLFAPLELRGVVLRNRIGVSPMCQYSSVDGFATDWHLVHLGGFAKGGAGLVVVESTAVVPEGRISPGDLGLWKDEQIPALGRITRFVEGQGAVPAIQLGHAGRKASTPPPWERGKYVEPADGGWAVCGPSPVPFDAHHAEPIELTAAEIAELPDHFARAARRALRAGFRIVEIHAAHGYLLHQFLSPLSNLRTDAWGGSFERRIRLTVAVASAVREEVGDDVPLFVRVSATDWAEGGWEADDTVELARRLREVGVDLIDCSTGGNVPRAQIPVEPGYQVTFAESVRQRAGIATAAVGIILEPQHADALIRAGRADLVLLGRALLRHPSWAQAAAVTLGARPTYPVQYGWALEIAPEALAASTAAGSGLDGGDAALPRPS